VVPLAALHPAPVFGPLDARDPGGVLPIPPSASAGLRSAGGSAEEASSGKSWREPASPSTRRPVEPRHELPVAPERRSATIRVIRAEIGEAALLVDPLSPAAAARLLAHTRVETRTEICAESKEGEPGEEIRTPTSRTSLVAVSQPVVTP
jgi:hypothetical protein